MRETVVVYITTSDGTKWHIVNFFLDVRELLKVNQSKVRSYYALFLLDWI